MKKQILYFTLLLQVTNITLSFDPLSIGLFAGAVSLFSARQRALDQNKNTTVYQYNPNEIKFEHPQDIIQEKLADKPYFDKNGELTQEAKNLTDKLFFNNSEFLNNLKTSKEGLNYYADNTDDLHKSTHQKNKGLKDEWWMNKLREIITSKKKSVNTDSSKENGANLVTKNIQKQITSYKTDIDFNTANLSENGKPYLETTDLQNFSLIFKNEKKKNPDNFLNSAITKFSTKTIYQPRKDEFLQVAELNESVPLVTIPAYKPFPWLARLKKPESFSNGTTRYSSVKYIFEEEK
ncbi:MAG: hypothetical protein K2X69_05605 [Silvanigrellaceae bacterium]|nr:hypothetical protein [Silvanigrellaceae bacterium]